jgi:hypothetical protein
MQCAFCEGSYTYEDNADMEGVVCLLLVRLCLLLFMWWWIQCDFCELVQEWLLLLLILRVGAWVNASISSFWILPILFISTSTLSFLPHFRFWTSFPCRYGNMFPVNFTRLTHWIPLAWNCFVICWMLWSSAWHSYFRSENSQLWNLCCG